MLGTRGFGRKSLLVDPLSKRESDSAEFPPRPPTSIKQKPTSDASSTSDADSGGVFGFAVMVPLI